MYSHDYTLTLVPQVTITFDKKGNVAAHNIDFASQIGWLADNNTSDLFPTLQAAETKLGKIIYGALMEYVDTLAVVQMYYSPDDEPF